MKTIRQFVVDAFTRKQFEGNPAAVCLLDARLPDETLASIARENNLSETAFLIGKDGRYDIRWFTPAFEVDLCGHATLASAFVVLNFVEPGRRRVEFESKSGPLAVERTNDLYSLDFPSRPGKPVSCPPGLAHGLGLKPRETFLSRDYLVVVDSEEQVAACSPDFPALRRLSSFGIIVTAPGTNRDFVSRAFFPTDAVMEDPVTGSAHCTLVPYWSKRLGKAKLHARQISERGGDLFCVDRGERVEIAGHAVLFSEGAIHLPLTA